VKHEDPVEEESEEEDPYEGLEEILGGFTSSWNLEGGLA
jgi:hypothetical protein